MFPKFSTVYNPPQVVDEIASAPENTSGALVSSRARGGYIPAACTAAVEAGTEALFNFCSSMLMSSLIFCGMIRA